MALAAAKAAPLKPEIRLSQSLTRYEAALTDAQKREYQEAGPPDAKAVMALTYDINRRNEKKKTRCLGARLDTFLNSVQGFTAVVDLIVGSAGNPVAGAVWGAVKVALQSATAFEGYFDSLSTMLMNVGLNSPRFEKYGLLYPASASLQKELCVYFATVIDLCTRIITFLKKPMARQIVSALRRPFNDEFGDLRKDLDRLSITVKDEVTLASAQQQNVEIVEASRERKESSLFRAAAATFHRETANQLSQAKRWRVQKLKARFLNSCSRYDPKKSLNQARKKGRSTWILDDPEYQKWRSKGSASTLICSGIVGAGKTILCASVIEQLVMETSADFSLGYFFCRSDEVTSLKAREMAGSLSRQMLEHLPDDAFDIARTATRLGDALFDVDDLKEYLIKLLPR